MSTIKTRIIRIGNSRGIRIPKVLIDQLGLESEVELAVEGEQLVIRPASHPRAEWEDQFATMADRGDDGLLDEPVPTEWDRSEWTW